VRHADDCSQRCLVVAFSWALAVIMMYVLCRFHPWPAEALVSVASRFLVDLPAVEESVREAIASHMAFAHQTVTTASKQ